MPRLFCFGLGYTARALAADLKRDGWRIAGTCREAAELADLTALGYEMHRFDGIEAMPDAAAALNGTTHLLSSIPPGSGGDPVRLLHDADIATVQGLAWVGYLSTTGVYGDRDGGWVDEGSPRTPPGARGRARVAAEDSWRGLGGGSAPHLFRLAGIYGPGRNAIETARRGQARRIVKPDQVFSRIHRDDIVSVLRASMANPEPGAVYNVCDDEAAPPQDVIAFACELLGLEAPPEEAFEDAALSDMAKSFYRDNKRVSNRRIKERLGVTLKYPNYRQGLEALLR